MPARALHLQLLSPALTAVFALVLSSQAALAQTPQTEDFTDKLRLIPGLRAVFSIHDGVDTRWKHLGDYDFTAIVEPKTRDCAYSYKWEMSAPASASGVRAVSLADVRSAHGLSLFYPDKQECTLDGFTNLLRISDELYQELAAGQEAKFELDGPQPVMVLHQEQVKMPHTLKLAARPELEMNINGSPERVRTIQATADNGWSYWILDNPKFPLVVKGDGPFKWDPPSLTVAIASTKSGADEGKRIVDSLKATGEATSRAILFDFDSAKLQPSAKPILDQIGAYLKSDAKIHLQIEGHTDNVGTSQYNMKLSGKRAASVQHYLVQHGRIGAERLRSKGFGFTQPVAPNTTAAGRAQNRRVVFKQIADQ